jgi:NAD-dependent DNA ligase
MIITTTLDLVKQAVIDGTIETLSILVITEGLIQADDMYYNDEESPLTDDQYDALRMYAQRLAPTESYFTGIGSEVRGGKINLPYKMGSLNQVYQGDFEKWIEKHSLQHECVVATDKLDGMSAMLVYGKDGKLQIAYSRGDGTQGADITRHVSKIHNVPKQIRAGGNNITIRGEVIITPVNFAKIKDQVKSKSGKKYKNPRNFIAGRMNASDGQDIVYAHIDFVAYEVVGAEVSKSHQLAMLNANGFSTVNFFRIDAEGLNDETLTRLLNTRREHTIYEIDGLVIEVDDATIRARINPTTDTLNPEYAVKFKIADVSNYAETEVVNVSWSISKDGYLKPTVQVKPIELCGVTIQNCTGFNAKFIRDNNIGKGAIVAIVRSGDVIPFLTKVVKPADAPDMPTEDATWTETGVDLVVTDAKNNPVVKFEKLNDFFTSLDVPNLGEGNLRPMFDAGFETPDSIIGLTTEDIGCLIGSRVVAKKIFTGIREKLTNVPMYVLMGSHSAFGRGIGKRKFKKLWEAFQGDMENCTDVAKIVSTEGFDVKTAIKIVSGYVEFTDFMNQIHEYVTIAPYIQPAKGSFSGLSVVFTGFRSKELEQAIETQGGKIGSGVSSKTSLLVTNDPSSTSGKAQKARDLGVKVIGEAELRAML